MILQLRLPVIIVFNLLNACCSFRLLKYEMTDTEYVILFITYTLRPLSDINHIKTILFISFNYIIGDRFILAPEQLYILCNCVV